MKIKIFVFVIISIFLIPAFVNAQEVNAQLVEQIPISDQNFQYTENITDFRSTISKYDPIWSNGIYSGPHLPPVKYELAYTGEYDLRINFTLGFDIFTYGASDYYIYLPILNSPDQLQFLIYIENSTDSFTFLSDDFYGEEYGAYNYSVLHTHHFIDYYSDLGYIIHNSFFPLRSGISYRIDIHIHPLTSFPLILYLSQTQLSILDNTSLFISSTYDNVDHSIMKGVKKEISNIPIAFAFLATEGLTSFGLGAVQLPGSIGLVISAMQMPGGHYATLDMPFHFNTPSRVIINCTFTAQSGGYQTQTEAFVKNFIIASTPTKMNSEGGMARFRIYPVDNQSYIVFVSTQKESYDPYDFDIYLYDRILNGLNPAGGGESTREWGYSEFGDYIVASLKPTANRYVPLNSSSWTLSRLQFSKLALQNAILLQYYNLQNMVPGGSLVGTIASTLEAKELIAEGAYKIPAPHVGFSLSLSLSHLKNVLFNFGKIIYQQLLKFWNYVTKELNLFWNWISPVLQLGIYFIFIIGVMFMMRYLGKLAIRGGVNEVD